MPPAHLKKGSPAAKAYMAHLRSLRGKGCHARGRRAGKNLVGGILGPMALLGPGLKIGKWIGKKIIGAIKKKKEGQTSGGNKIVNEVLKRAKLAALIARAQAAAKGGALPIPDESVFKKPPYRIPLSRPSRGKEMLTKEQIERIRNMLKSKN